MRGSITKRVAVLSVAALLAGCASKLTHESVTLSNGRQVDYVVGKVAGDGQEGIFRDAYVDGAPVLSHFGSGQSLAGQVLQGAAGSAFIAGGMVGAAALLRPPRYNSNETTNLDNQQGQSQAQDQDQGAYSGSDSYAGSHAEGGNATATNKNNVSNTSINANSNNNTSKIKVSDVGGGSEGGGGVPGCQKAKNGC